MADFSQDWMEAVVIAVSIFAGTLLIFLVGILIYYCYCRRKPNDSETKGNEETGFDSLSLSSLDQKSPTNVNSNISDHSPRSLNQMSPSPNFFTMPERRTAKTLPPMWNFPAVNPRRRYRARKRHSFEKRRFSGAYVEKMAPRLQLTGDFKRRPKSHLGVSSGTQKTSGTRQLSHIHAPYSPRQPRVNYSTSGTSSATNGRAGNVTVTAIGVGTFGNTSTIPASLQGKPFRVAGDHLQNPSSGGRHTGHVGDPVVPMATSVLPIGSEKTRNNSYSDSSQIIGPVLMLDRSGNGQAVTSQHDVITSAENAYATGTALWQ